MTTADAKPPGSDLDGRGRLDDDVRRRLDDLARRLARRSRLQLRVEGFRPAAVLLPLVARHGRLALTLLRRSEDGGIHSGQIALPGGACEPTDAGLEATATREAEEEVGLPAAAVQVLGRLDDTATISHYVVTPVVGLVLAPPATYRPDPHEAQEAFEVPLDWLLDPANEERAPDATFLGRTYPMWRYVYEERVIWGVTARILHDFLDLLRSAPHAPDPSSPETP